MVLLRVQKGLSQEFSGVGGRSAPAWRPNMWRRGCRVSQWPRHLCTWVLWSPGTFARTGDPETRPGPQGASLVDKLVITHSCASVSGAGRVSQGTALSDAVFRELPSIHHRVMWRALVRTGETPSPIVVGCVQKAKEFEFGLHGIIGVCY